MKVSTLGGESGTLGARAGKKGKKAGKSLFFALFDKARVGSANIAGKGQHSAKSNPLAGLDRGEMGRLLEQLQDRGGSAQWQALQKAKLKAGKSKGELVQLGSKRPVKGGTGKTGEDDSERLLREALAYLKNEKAEGGEDRKRKPILGVLEDWAAAEQAALAVAGKSKGKQTKGKTKGGEAESAIGLNTEAAAKKAVVETTPRVRLLKKSAGDEAGKAGANGDAAKQGAVVLKTADQNGEKDGKAEVAAIAKLMSGKDGDKAAAILEQLQKDGRPVPTLTRTKRVTSNEHGEEAGFAKMQADAGGNRAGEAMSGGKKPTAAGQQNAGKGAPKLRHGEAADLHREPVAREMGAEVTDIRYETQKVKIPKPRLTPAAGDHARELPNQAKVESKPVLAETMRTHGAPVKSKNKSGSKTTSVGATKPSESGKGANGLRDALAQAGARERPAPRPTEARPANVEVNAATWQASDTTNQADQDFNQGFLFQRNSAGGAGASESTAAPRRGGDLSFAAVQQQANQRAEASTETTATSREAFPRPGFSMLEDGMEEAYLIRPKSVTVKLKPVELGEVRITVSREGDQMQAQIETQSSRTAKLIRDNQAELEQTMRERGMDFERFDVREDRDAKDQNEQRRQAFARQSMFNGDAQERREAYQERRETHGGQHSERISEAPTTPHPSETVPTTTTTTTTAIDPNAPLDVTA